MEGLVARVAVERRLRQWEHQEPGHLVKVPTVKRHFSSFHR
jgi:hypothetical protein